MSSPARALSAVKRVLFAPDFSDCSRLAWPYARAITSSRSRGRRFEAAPI